MRVVVVACGVALRVFVMRSCVCFVVLFCGVRCCLRYDVLLLRVVCSRGGCVGV